MRSGGAARALRGRGVRRSARARRARATCASIGILDAARRAGADAVHPGYGFLAENEDFAAAVRDAGLTFIGPTPEAIALMGSKTAARTAAMRAGVPVVPGTRDAARRRRRRTPTSRGWPSDIGYPLLVKAVAGGGGKGMRTVADPAELAGAVRARAVGGRRGVRRRRRVPRAPHRCGRGTSKCSCSATSTARCCRSSSANARSSAAIRRWSRRRRRWP